jgi:hypothetical protein
MKPADTGRRAAYAEGGWPREPLTEGGEVWSPMVGWAGREQLLLQEDALRYEGTRHFVCEPASSGASRPHFGA